MCVIVAGRDHKASSSVLWKCREANGDGMGVAWTEKDGTVRFERDITVPEMKRLIDAAPGDWVAHFRIATVGKTKDLVHPFVVSSDSPLIKSGETDDQVLFHNGHWNDWEGICSDLRDEFKLTVPEGPWSDSRAAAWLTAHVGPVALEMLPGKYALLGAGGYMLFPLNHDGWYGFEGMWFSNDHWKFRSAVRSQSATAWSSKYGEQRSDREAASIPIHPPAAYGYSGTRGACRTAFDWEGSGMQDGNYDIKRIMAENKDAVEAD